MKNQNRRTHVETGTEEVKVRQVKTLWSYEPHQLDFQVNQFYILNPDIEEIDHFVTSVHRPQGTVFCYTIVAWVWVNLTEDSEEDS